MTECCSAERRCELRYGKGTVALDLSQAASVSWLYGNEMPSISDLPEAFRRAVEEDCEGAPLRARLSAGDRVTKLSMPPLCFRQKHNAIYAKAGNSMKILFRFIIKGKILRRYWI